GIDLDDLAGNGGLEAFGKASGMTFADQAEAASARLATKRGDRHDHAAPHQAFEDAADGRDGDDEAFAPQQPDQLPLAPHWIVGAKLLDRLRQRKRPLWAAHIVG